MSRCMLCVCVLLFLNGIECRQVSGSQLTGSGTVVLQTEPSDHISVDAVADYVLGPGDQITLVVPGLEEQYGEKMFRIDASGDVSLPLIGRMHASGMSTAALEGEMQIRLRSVLKDPTVVVSIATFGSEPVSVLGAVKNPGIVQLQGRKSLFEVLSMAGGLQPDAGYVVEVSRSLKRGNIPLATVRIDPSSEVGIASIRLKDIINVSNESENIQILPDDAVSVPKAGIVYVIGSVLKPGGYTLDENESLPALQVLSLAEGLQATAAGSKARILRPVPGSSTRVEIPVDLKHLISGKTEDVQLHAGDILYVPSSTAKKVGLRSIEAIINASIYMPVYAGL